MFYLRKVRPVDVREADRFESSTQDPVARPGWPRGEAQTQFDLDPVVLADRVAPFAVGDQRSPAWEFAAQWAPRRVVPGVGRSLEVDGHMVVPCRVVVGLGRVGRHIRVVGSLGSPEVEHFLEVVHLLDFLDKRSDTIYLAVLCKCRQLCSQNLRILNKVIRIL